MKAHTAGDLEAAEVEAADLLALARLDDDGAPCPGVVPRAQPGSTGPDNDRSPRASRGPAGACHHTRRIAAGPGRRRQLTPALIGVG